MSGEDADNRYRSLAYRRAIYGWLIQKLDAALPENYLFEATEIFCDTLPYEERRVPATSVVEVLGELQRIEDELKRKMDRFRRTEDSDEG